MPGLLEHLEPRSLLAAAPPDVVQFRWNRHTVSAVRDEWLVGFGAGRRATGVAAESVAQFGAGVGFRWVDSGGGAGLLSAPGVSFRRLSRWAASISEAVVSVTPNFVVGARSLPNDPAFGQSTGLHDVANDADIDAPEAWDLTTGSRDVVVAVVDTGVDYTHPDLAANVWSNPGEVPGNGRDDDENGWVDDVHGFDFGGGDSDPMDTLDPVPGAPAKTMPGSGHGTHIAGIVGAVGNNGVGSSGVNWRVRVMALDVFTPVLDAGVWRQGVTAGAVVRALGYVRDMRSRGVEVVAANLSLGGLDFSETMLGAIRELDDAGVLVVASAGNEARDSDAVPRYPSSYDAPNVLAVGATDGADGLASFSNFGAREVDLAAPGLKVFSTYPGGQYRAMSGTSQAAPLVTGVAALLEAHRPNATHRDVRDAIMGGVDPLPALAGKTVSGGRLNARGALDRLDAKPLAPFAGDVDGDGRADLIVPRHDGSRGVVVEASFARKGGRFTPAVESVLGGGAGVLTAAARAGDVNGDGRADLMLAYHEAGSGVRVRTSLAGADGRFAAARETILGGGREVLEHVFAADADGDGRSDYVFAFYDPAVGVRVRAVLADEQGKLGAARESVLGDGPAGVLAHARVGDVNGDGRADLVLPFYDTKRGTRVRVALARADGTYAATVETVLGDGPAVFGREFVADANGDGRDDLVFAFHDASTGVRVRTARSGGDGRFAATTEAVIGGGAFLLEDARAVDANGDGRGDLVFPFYDTKRGMRVRTSLAGSRGTFGGVVESILGDPAGVREKVLAGDVTGDGEGDLIFVFTRADATRGVRASLSRGDGLWGRTTESVWG